MAVNHPVGGSNPSPGARLKEGSCALCAVPFFDLVSWWTRTPSEHRTISEDEVAWMSLKARKAGVGERRQDVAKGRPNPSPGAILKRGNCP